MTGFVSAPNWSDEEGGQLVASSEAGNLSTAALPRRQVFDVWRTSGASPHHLTASFPGRRPIGVVALLAPRDRLLPEPGARIRLTMSDVSATGSEVLDTGFVNFEMTEGRWIWPVGVNVDPNRIWNACVKGDARGWTAGGTILPTVRTAEPRYALDGNGSGVMAAAVALGEDDKAPVTTTPSTGTPGEPEDEDEGGTTTPAPTPRPVAVSPPVIGANSTPRPVAVRAPVIGANLIAPPVGVSPPVIAATLRPQAVSPPFIVGTPRPVGVSPPFIVASPADTATPTDPDKDEPEDTTPTTPTPTPPVVVVPGLVMETAFQAWDIGLHGDAPVEAQMMLAPNGCTATLGLRWITAAGAVLFTVESAPVDNRPRVTTRAMVDYVPVRVSGVPPAGARYAQLVVIGRRTKLGNTAAPFVVFTRAALSGAVDGLWHSTFITPRGQPAAYNRMARYVRVTIETTQPYFQVGRFWTGPAVFTGSADYGVRDGLGESGAIERNAASGATFTRRGRVYTSKGFSFNELTTEEKTALFDMIADYIGTTQQALVSPIMERGARDARLGLVAASSVEAAYEAHNVELTVEEAV